MKKASLSMDSIFVMTLFVVFAAMVLLVLGTGAGVYKNTVKTMDSRYETRTALAYITEISRHYDAADISTDSFGTVPALRLKDTFSGAEYDTYIYYYKGYLREVFARSDVSVQPGAGKKILAVKGLTFTQDKDGMITVGCKASDGTVSSVMIYAGGNS